MIEIKLENLKYLKKENIFIFNSDKPGQKVCILAGVHGDEMSGILAIKNIVKNFSIDFGSVCFIICNQRAIDKNKRFVEENLNRCFLKNKKKTDSYEENLANEIKPILKKFDICLDLHNSYTKGSKPFLICEKNSHDLIDSIDTKVVVSNFDKLEPGGTDYFMNRNNKIGICLECGFLDDEKGISFAEESIINFLKKTKNIEGNSKKFLDKKYFFLEKNYVPKKSFKTYKKFKDFEELEKGDLIGFDNFKKVIAKEKSYILFARNVSNNFEEAFKILKKTKI